MRCLPATRAALLSAETPLEAAKIPSDPAKTSSGGCRDTPWSSQRHLRTLHRHPQKLQRHPLEVAQTPSEAAETSSGGCKDTSGGCKDAPGKALQPTQGGLTFNQSGGRGRSAPLRGSGGPFLSAICLSVRRTQRTFGTRRISSVLPVCCLPVACLLQADRPGRSAPYYFDCLTSVKFSSHCKKGPYDQSQKEQEQAPDR